MILDKSELRSKVSALQTAILENDSSSAQQSQDWVMGVVAVALCVQDKRLIRELRAAVADLVALYDAYILEDSGERWRTLSEMLQAFCDTVLPLEQLRLADPASCAGTLLRAIVESPGISMQTLIRLSNIGADEVEQQLGRLIDEGLITQIGDGQEACYCHMILPDSSVANIEPFRSLLKRDAELYRRDVS